MTLAKTMRKMREIIELLEKEVEALEGRNESLKVPKDETSKKQPESLKRS